MYEKLDLAIKALIILPGVLILFYRYFKCRDCDIKKRYLQQGSAQARAQKDYIEAVKRMQEGREVKDIN